MSTLLVIDNIQTISKKFKVEIEIGTGAIAETLYPKLIEFGDFIIGNDDPLDESIMYPGQHKISFNFPVAETFSAGVFLPTHQDAVNSYQDTFLKLRVEGAETRVYEYLQGGGLDLFFVGNVVTDPGMIKGNDRNRTIEITSYDQFADLNQTNEDHRSDDSFPQGKNYPYGGSFQSKVSFKDVIQYYLPKVQAINFRVPFRFLVAGVDTPNDDFYCDAENLGGENLFIYDNDKFETRGQVLKGIFGAFAGTAVIGFNRTLEILPRFYDGSPVVHLDKKEMIDTPELSANKTYKGTRNYFLGEEHDQGLVEYKVKRPPNLRDDNPHTEYSNELLYPDEIKDFDFQFILGDKDKNSNGTSKYVYYFNPDGSTRPIYCNRVSVKNYSGNYGSESSLANWSSWLIFNSLNGGIRKVKVKVFGTGYWFNNFFTIDGIENILRPIKLSFNYHDDITELTLLECKNPDELSIIPARFKFTKMLRAKDVKLFIEDTLYTGNTNGITVAGKHIGIQWGNSYTDTSTTATEYDGNEISVDNIEAYKTINQYAIYRYVSYDNQPPELPYPNFVDLNGAWELIATVDDIQSTDPDYIYFYDLGRNGEQHDVWYFVAAVSYHADLLKITLRDKA